MHNLVLNTVLEDSSCFVRIYQRIFQIESSRENKVHIEVVNNVLLKFLDDVPIQGYHSGIGSQRVGKLTLYT